MSSKNSNLKEIHIYLNDDFYKKLQLKSKVKNVSIPKYITSLITKDISSDTSDEALFIYHIDQMKKKIENVEKITDTFGGLFFHYLYVYFQHLPEEKDPKVKEQMKEFGRNRVGEFIESYKKLKTKYNTSFIYSIFGNMLEEDDVFDKYKPVPHKKNDEELGKSK